MLGLFSPVILWQFHRVACGIVGIHQDLDELSSGVFFRARRKTVTLKQVGVARLGIGPLSFDIVTVIDERKLSRSSLFTFLLDVCHDRYHPFPLVCGCFPASVDQGARQGKHQRQSPWSTYRESGELCLWELSTAPVAPQKEQHFPFFDDHLPTHDFISPCISHEPGGTCDFCPLASSSVGVLSNDAKYSSNNRWTKM